jgi:hypothetical protein
LPSPKSDQIKSVSLTVNAGADVRNLISCLT